MKRSEENKKYIMLGSCNFLYDTTKKTKEPRPIARLDFIFTRDNQMYSM